MMNLKQNEIIEKVISSNGRAFQSMVAMEECSELVQAISKCIREPEGEDARKRLVEEMADVSICLRQLKTIYHVTDDELRIWTAIKLDRLEKRLNQTQQKG